MKCPQCGAGGEQPGPDNRYCPLCGQMLVMRDPPDNAESRAWMVLGRHAIGPETGNIYRYDQALHPPYRVDPLIASPAEGMMGGDLWSSSSALPGTRVVDWAPASAPAPRENGGWTTTRDLVSVAARHGVLYTVAGRTHQVEAWDVGLGQRIGRWAFGEAQMDGLLRHSGTGVSETLVYGACRAPNGGLLALRALHAGTGRLVFDLPIHQTDAQVEIAGRRAYVLGQAHDGMMSVGALDIDGTHVREHEAASVDLVPDTPKAPWPTAMTVLGGDRLVFVGEDSRVYWWRPEDSERPAMIYAPPPGYRGHGHVYDLGEMGIGLMFQADTIGAAPILLRVAADGSREPAGVAGLPQMPSQPYDRSLAACGGSLLACAHHPGEALRIVKRRANLDQGAWDPLTTLAGTQRTRHFCLHAVPLGSQTVLAIQVVQDNTRSTYLVNPQTGAVTPVDLHPHVEDDVRIVWTGGSTMRVNLANGNVQVLG